MIIIVEVLTPFKILFCVVKSTKVYFIYLLQHMGIIKKK